MSRSEIATGLPLVTSKLILVVALLMTDCSVESANITIAYFGRAMAPWGPQVTMLNSGSGILMAKDFVNANSSILPSDTIHIIPIDDACNEKVSLEAAINMSLYENVDAFIGPTCATSCISVGLLASQWNIPTIGYFCGNSELTDKRRFDTFLRTVQPIEKTGDALTDVVMYFNWTNIGIMRGRNELGTLTGYQEFLYEGMVQFAEEKNITILGSWILPNPMAASSMAEFAEETRIAVAAAAANSRIIVLITDTPDPDDPVNRPNQVDMFVYAAYDLGLFATNEYVIILPSIYKDEVHASLRWLYPINDTEADMKMRAAFDHILFVNLYPFFIGEAYEHFRNETFYRLQTDFNSHISSSDEVSGNAATLYDALLFYALTAQRMRDNGLDIRDGRSFFDEAQFVAFNGKSGQVSVDVYGDRNMDFQVYRYIQDNFVDVGYYNSFNRDLHMYQEIVWAHGTTIPPVDVPLCGFQGEFCIVEELDPMILVVIVAGVLLIIMFIVIGFIQYKKKQAYEAELLAANWRIDYTKLDFSKTVGASMISTASRGGMDQTGENFAMFEGDKVCVKRLLVNSLDWRKRTVLVELKRLREIQHDNVLPFVGASVDPPDIVIVNSLCQKGSLDDVLQNPDMQLDQMFRISICLDIVNGLKFIHKSDVGFHGRLRSYNTLVDNRWNIKLSGFGLRAFTADHYDIKSKEKDFSYYRKKLWTAPEFLLDDSTSAGSAKGDVYGLGIIMHEVSFRNGPWGTNVESPDEIFEILKKDNPDNPYRPECLDCEDPEKYQQLMEICWQQLPDERPELNAIGKKLIEINGGKKINIMDNMVQMLEKYANNLEGIVAERTSQLAEEKKKTETLLFQMLPKAVANELKEGRPIPAESFDAVTIFFSDIVGFTSMSAASTPFEVVNLLNDLYTNFDSIIDMFDVYKVETIGDAYMVVSGLPTRNGDRHAGEIASMSLELLSCILDFKIRHMPGTKLLLRIGMHSGSVVAGVVGLKMPRYCLFGDTVNTASRMESNGLALHIHVSIFSKKVLDILGGYHLVERGLIEMKGKGKQMTYWLKGRDGYTKRLPEESDMPK